MRPFPGNIRRHLLRYDEITACFLELHQTRLGRGQLWEDVRGGWRGFPPFALTNGKYVLSSQARQKFFS
jgi:hypothetical protein